MSLHRFIRGLTDPGNGFVIRWPLPAFSAGLFALLGGNSLMFSMVVVICHALSLITNWQHPNQFCLIATADCIDFLLFYVPRHRSFNSEVIVDYPPESIKSM
jgi:hypothetical protein